MRFGPVSVEDAIGALVAHSVRAGGTLVKKGTHLTADMAALLKSEGIDQIVAVRLEAGDVHFHGRAGGAGPGARVHAHHEGHRHCHAGHRAGDAGGGQEEAPTLVHTVVSHDQFARKLRVQKRCILPQVPPRIPVFPQ